MRAHASLPLLALTLLMPLPARAEEGAAAPPAASGTASQVSPDLTARPSRELDLLLDERAPLPARDPAFEQKVQQRRTLLTAHQAAGLATWGLLASTVVVGQLNYNDLYGNGGYTQKYRETHVALAGATAASFAFTGILALAAPEPYRKPLRLDTATVHKASMALTTLGMVGQIVLGYATHNAHGYLQQKHLAQAHQALGYATLGTMTIGAVSLAF